MDHYVVLIKRTDGQVLNCFVEGDPEIEPSGALAIYRKTGVGRRLVEAWSPDRWIEIKLDLGSPVVKRNGVDVRA